MNKSSRNVRIVDNVVAVGHPLPSGVADLGAGRVLVSIGVPVFNGAATLTRAVASLCQQTHRDIEILLSDNASTDLTSEVCKTLVQSDSRVSYVRQLANLGAVANFVSVLGRAKGEYFMWAAADDFWMPEFVERNLAALLEDPKVVGSISCVQWQADTLPVVLASGTKAIAGNRRKRLSRYLASVADNSRFYGVYRTTVLQQAIPSTSFYGWDLAVMAGTLMLGSHHELEETLMVRAFHDPDSYIGTAPRPAAGLGRWFPLAAWTRCLFNEVRVPRSPAVVAAVAVRNLTTHWRIVEYDKSIYGKGVARLLALIRPLLERRRFRTP